MGELSSAALEVMSESLQDGYEFPAESNLKGEEGGACFFCLQVMMVHCRMALEAMGGTGLQYMEVK